MHVLCVAKKYPAFQKALKEAKTIPNLDIETSMIDLACGRAYVEDIVQFMMAVSGMRVFSRMFKFTYLTMEVANMILRPQKGP